MKKVFVFDLDDTLMVGTDIFPEVFDVLDFLYNQGDVPMLLSKGDKVVQDRKFSAIDAGNNFFRSRVVDQKTPEVFEKLVGGFMTYHPWYSVGNDYISDIAPALEVGFKGIWIPNETWENQDDTDKIRSSVDWSRCIEMKSLMELKERYREL